MTSNDSVIYFSLDLSSNQEEPRVKMCVAHRGISSSQIAQKQTAICPDANTYEIQRFCETMAGGSLGPYQGKALLSCFAFTSKAPTRPDGMVHLPIYAYVQQDAEAQQRSVRYMNAVRVSPLYGERYRNVVSAVQRRPIEGHGIHSWVSLKRQAGGRMSNALYLSPELFGSSALFGQG